MPMIKISWWIASKAEIENAQRSSRSEVIAVAIALSFKQCAHKSSAEKFAASLDILILGQDSCGKLIWRVRPLLN